MSIFDNFYFLKRNLFLRVATGIAYAENPYDIDTNPNNNAYGTHLLGSSYFMLGYNKKDIFKGVGLKAGLALIHYSNSSVKSPNSSANTFAATLGVNYQIDVDTQPSYTTSAGFDKIKQPIHFNMVLRGGIQEGRVIGLGQKPFVVVSGYVDKRLSFKSSIQVGVDAIFAKFLETEIERKVFYQLNKLQPKAYKSKIDSIVKFKLNTYRDYIEKHPKETESYFKILKTALIYPIYSKVERYPINHVYISREDSFPKIETSFYEYRKNLNYNSNSLMYYTPYARYMTNYLYNLTYTNGHQPMKEEFSSDFTLDLLKTIDTKISSKNSKNALLKRTVLDHFYRKSSCDLNQKAFDLFLTLSSNKKDKLLVKNLVRDNKVVRKGDEIKGFKISDFTNQPINIEDFTINKNSVLLFWDKKYISKSFIGSRIPFLQKKYPLLNFAVIEIDGDNTNRIKNIDIKNQYFINSKTLKNNFLTSKIHRTILVNKNGIVENGYASISSGNIYKQLKELSEIN